MQLKKKLQTQAKKEEKFSSLEVTYEEEYALAWYRMNAKPRPCFTIDLLDDIQTFFNKITMGHDHKALDYIVMGSSIPGSFNLGGDLKLFNNLIQTNNRKKLLEYAVACIKPLHQIHTGLNKGITTISLVQGDALGGGFEVAVSSDALIVEKSAKLGMPEILFNLFPGMGAISFLSRKIGIAAAEKMILSGKLYSAEEVYNMGLIDVLAEDGEGEQAVYNYIKKENKTRNGFQAFRKAKKYCDPVTYDELEKITNIWVDAALQLGNKDLRMMERLVKRQSAKASQ